ncbi:MAG: NUDIX hydrolase [archaeon]|nr:NUDIX hydrolase [archaeon]MCR4324048.1 NUDIX hydrolase [Nanoarchaeota archaeon]
MGYKFEIEHEDDILDAEWINSNKVPKLIGRVHIHAFVFNNKGEILLVHFPNKNIWQLPGGKLEEGETIEECLRREVDEEADIDIKELKFYGYLKAKGRKSGIIDYGLRYITKVKKIKEQTPDPCEKIMLTRKFVKPNEFIKYTKWGENGELQLKKALKVFKDSSKTPPKTL